MPPCGALNQSIGQIIINVGNVTTEYIPSTRERDTTIRSEFEGSSVSLLIPQQMSTNRDLYADLATFDIPIVDTPPTGYLFDRRYFQVIIEN